MTIATERIPRWIIAIGVIGTPLFGVLAGTWSGLAFAAGAAGSWWNFRYLQRAVAELAEAAVTQSTPSTARIVGGLLTRLLVLGLGSIVILKYSKTSLIALLAGLFASLVAVFVEILYGLLWKSTKSG